ncbi:MAG: inositol monophosphatase [Candidatus Magasanikbacteria bacterium]|nr:inositol monophosphatase [Candidatus Magasanikbacteria bacterium]
MKSKELKIAIKIARKVNTFLKKEFNSLGQTEIETKKHGEIVTKADKKANIIIIKELERYFSTDNIISEESPAIENGSERTWFVDPLDGTSNFAYGFKEFTTHISFAEKGKIKLGVVGSPLTNEVFWAEKGGGAFVNNKKISVSEPKHTQMMALICGGHTKQGVKELNKVFKNLNEANARVRIFAAAGVELTSVASGKADVCIMTEVHSWDVIAGIAILREAGGKATNFEGEDWQIGDTNIVATNGKLHKKALGFL